MAIYDVIQFVKEKTPVTTICIGQACSAGSLILLSGSEGKRYALPNARVMIHQPSGGFRGQATDAKIHLDEMLRMKKMLNNIYSKHTKQPLDKIEISMERDYFMTPEEARDFGIIDKVIHTRSKII